MSISEQDIRHVARLARLQLNEDDIRLHTVQLSRILDYVNQIRGLDVDGVQPTFHVLAQLGNVVRKDQVETGLDTESALAAAPDIAVGQFKVPAVIEDGDRNE